MKPYKIYEPIWNGGKPAVGIAPFRVRYRDLPIEIMYKSRGQRSFPGIYLVKRQKINKYPLQLRKNVWLRIIPISELDAIPPH